MAYRYFIQLSYCGKAYHGWQIQPNALSVQEVLNEKLGLILREPINVVGAGRTDTGVHSEYFMAHFDLSYHIPDKNLILNGLNKMLPGDIAVQEIFQVDNEVNARFSALSRTYEYRIIQQKNPFLKDFAWYYKVPLNIGNMNHAAKILLEYNDFTSFSKLGTQVASNNCKIFFAEWIYMDKILIFRIKADRFLRNMVRAIVGTLIEVGTDKIDLVHFRATIERKDRCAAGFSVPAQGLFLTDIEYPENIRQNAEIKF
jgi:tRNA pseudouridine38-40 synthase